jgi:DNA-binding beta-propeller fold protein YncE
VSLTVSQSPVPGGSKSLPVGNGQENGGSPFGIAATADGAKIFATNLRGDNLSVIKAAADISLASELLPTQAIGGREPLGEIVMMGELGKYPQSDYPSLAGMVR